MFKPFAIAILSLAAAGCATDQQNAALECGAGGAGAAFLLCTLAGGSAEKCALVGGGVGAVGAAGCYAISSKLAKDREVLKGRENDLDARLEYVRKVNQTVAQYNDTLRQQVADLSQHNATTGEQLAVSTNDQARLTKQRKQIDAAMKEAKKSIADQQQALDDNRAYQAQYASKSQALATAIKQEEARLDDTKRQLQALASLNQNA